MDGKPVSETMMANASAFNSLANKNISIEEMGSDSAKINVGSIQVGTTQSGLAPALPEVAKGTLIDITL